ncbi:hypothetical protein A9Q84_19880 [Halobacteriovorax marinus]|uniref:Uncharacterized protein n=1 Tax=Halobacteriovorax marinus TaxID=97084 RepID=A0A1Y5F2T4_9BACT|nr:hypothetical protein A9Q84_19880 [Halobacteriovorax marinus]
MAEEKSIVKKKTLIQKIRTNNKMLHEIYLLIKKNKKWWLMPIFMVFAVLSLFITLAGGSSILPAIYALF